MCTASFKLSLSPITEAKLINTPIYTGLPLIVATHFTFVDLEVGMHVIVNNYPLYIRADYHTATRIEH